MYSSNDEFTIKPNNIFPIPIPSEITQNYILSNPNYKFYPNSYNNNSNYDTFHDLNSTNPNNHAPSSSNNTSINSEHLILNSNDQELINENDDEHDIRRLKRMISNRESARRSRLRKRKQLETLQFQVCQLHKLNHYLRDQVDQLEKYNYEILQENAKLMQHSTAIRKNVDDMMINVSIKGGYEEEDNHNGGVFIRASQNNTSPSFASNTNAL